jgi:hypothetical protein
MMTYQPEMTLADIVALVDYDTMAPLANGIRAAYIMAHAEAEKRNPPVAAAPGE